MEFKDAQNLLPQFKTLIGIHSETFNQKIRDIFIGHTDAILSHLEYHAFRFDNKLPPLPSDKGKYTLCVGLENGRVHGVKNLVEVDNLYGLVPSMDQLDYMYDHPDAEKFGNLSVSNLQ